MESLEEKEVLSDEEEGGARRRGLSVWLAAIFIVGEMAGGGVLALPKALSDAGWWGVALLIFCCLITLYSGVCLGQCWNILEERWEEYRGGSRSPYADIAERAIGIKTRWIVAACVDLNLFGVATVFLLLSSQLVGGLIATYWDISFCYWILLLAAVICPLLWLATPVDFWGAAVIALCTTVTAVILLLVLLVGEIEDHIPPPEPSPPQSRVLSFFLAYGTMLFAFGGAASFPTFQNDMRDKTQFPRAAGAGFFVLLVLYLPVSVLGYFQLGDGIKPSVLSNFPDSAIKTAISILLALHMLFAFLLVINAVVQDLERLLRLPNNFGWRRVLLRSGLLLVSVFVAESVPRFGKVLNLVGGSATALTSTVFPCLFLERLSSQAQQPEWPDRSLSTWKKVLLLCIGVVGAAGGCLSTYSATSDIVGPDSFNPPCYVNLTAASLNEQS